MIQSVDNQYPLIPRSAYVHSTAVVIGDVELGKGASVWPNAVLRGDLRKIIIGEKTSIQDGCVLHTSKYNPDHRRKRACSGHNVTMHSCESRQSNALCLVWAAL